MRIDKPTGIYLFYLPHLFGTLYTASVIASPPSLLNLLVTNPVFFIGTIFIRGAACA